MSKLTPVLSANWDEADSFTIAGYKRNGGYTAVAKALAMNPDEVIQLVKDLVDGARAGNPPAPTRGPKTLRTWKQNSAVLAGISDGLANEGLQAGAPTLLGLNRSKAGK